jgi:hypothetical protein
MRRILPFYQRSFTDSRREERFRHPIWTKHSEFRDE